MTSQEASKAELKLGPTYDWVRLRRPELQLGLTLAEQAAKDETDVRGTFSEAAHEVWEPLPAERNVHPHTEAFGHERRLEIATDAVQHLELESILRDPLSSDQRLGPLDDLGIVRRKGRERTGSQQRFHQPEVCRV